MGKILRKYTLPGIKRWIAFAIIGFVVIGFGIALILKAHPVTVIANFTWDFLSLIAENVPPTISGIIAIVLGAFFLFFAFFSSNKQLLSLVAPEESSLLETLDRHYMEGKGIKVVAIGGGTGLSNMLRGIKHFTSNITAVVTVADDGGSSGRLRKELDIVPPGDIRNCIAALAADDEVITQLFQYRFDKAASKDLGGHSFGNLFLTALADMDNAKTMSEAVLEACNILRTRGTVLPLSNEPMHLVAEMDNGEIVKGESNITNSPGQIKKLSCEEPAPPILPEVIEAISEADLIVLGPGSLYTSIIPNLLVPELTKAIYDSSAIKIYACNVMTQLGETESYSVSDHLNALFAHAGSRKSDSLDSVQGISRRIADIVIANNSSPDRKQLEKYAEQNQHPVDLDLGKTEQMGVEVYATDLLQKGDLVRHNFKKLAKAIMTIYLRKENLLPAKKGSKESKQIIKEAIRSY